MEPETIMIGTKSEKNLLIDAGWLTSFFYFLLFIFYIYIYIYILP
jgi:hypothetical protein